MYLTYFDRIQIDRDERLRCAINTFYRNMAVLECRERDRRIARDKDLAVAIDKFLRTSVRR